MRSNIAGESSTNNPGPYSMYIKSRWKKCPPSPLQLCRAEYGTKNMQSSENLIQWKIPAPAQTIGALEGERHLISVQGKKGHCADGEDPTSAVCVRE